MTIERAAVLVQIKYTSPFPIVTPTLHLSSIRLTAQPCADAVIPRPIQQNPRMD